MSKTEGQGRIRVGIGGGSYAPWGGAFYPKGLKQAEELAYAGGHLAASELKAPQYRLKKRKRFRRGATADRER